MLVVDEVGVVVIDVEQLGCFHGLSPVRYAAAWLPPIRIFINPREKPANSVQKTWEPSLGDSCEKGALRMGH